MEQMPPLNPGYFLRLAKFRQSMIFAMTRPKKDCSLPRFVGDLVNPARRAALGGLAAVIALFQVRKQGVAGQNLLE